MGDAAKKQRKAEAKLAKKRAKAEIKAAKTGTGSASSSGVTPSHAVRYAESVRGILYVILGASLVVSLVLGQRGAIVSLDDLIDSIFAVTAGKIVLALVALAFVIYGLKHLRLVK